MKTEEKKKENKTFKDFGQAIENLYRRAFLSNREFIIERLSGKIAFLMKILNLL